MFLARLRAAHRATAGERVRGTQPLERALLVTSSVCRQTGSDIGEGTQAGRTDLSDASLPFFIGGRILESPLEAGISTSTAFNQGQNLTLMRIWQSISASQKNLNEAHKLRISVLAAEETFQMHGSCDVRFWQIVLINVLEQVTEQY